MSRTPSLPVALLRYIDLLAFSSHSSASRRRFESATGVAVPRSGIETLEILANSPLTGSELAATLRVDITQSSRQVTRLVRAGLVIKERAPDDGRRIVHFLSDYGLQVVLRWQRSWLTEMRRPLDTWADDDVNGFADWIECAVDRVRRTLPVPAGTEPDVAEQSGTRIAISEIAGNPVEARCLSAIADFVYLIGRADFDAALAKARVSLSPSQYFVLQDIGWFGPTSVSDVVSRLALDQAAASRTISFLESENLVLRTDGGSDRRSRPVETTASGASILARIRTSRLDSLRNLFADIDQDLAQHYAVLTDHYLDDVLSTADMTAVRYG
ncbi:MarR family transcriptional regulator [Rhodococcus sp. MS16]|uniref:MarR family transcriptional regulator n=1 Tax=Rhodococcus TaxID=1827 RepID=UPI001562CF04|nr:MarR family transcriptional regulator [Rhodococcus globerulus]MCE4267071.1 MarR family transcriptional regulator [Rhodococcus globerulus]NRI69219.1 MarR family transcriptional regulator [Rhodococcus sp. MS16]